MHNEYLLNTLSDYFYDKSAIKKDLSENENLIHSITEMLEIALKLEAEHKCVSIIEY